MVPFDSRNERSKSVGRCSGQFLPNPACAMDVTACKSRLPSGRERSSQSWFSRDFWLPVGGDAGLGESEESGTATSTTASVASAVASTAACTTPFTATSTFDFGSSESELSSDDSSAEDSAEAESLEEDSSEDESFEDELSEGEGGEGEEDEEEAGGDEEEGEGDDEEGEDEEEEEEALEADLESSTATSVPPGLRPSRFSVSLVVTAQVEFESKI